MFNDVRAGLIPPSSQPAIRRNSDELNVGTFRFGPNPNKLYEDSQFPTEALPQLFTQSVPDLNTTLPSPNPTYKALSDLAKDLNGAILMSHSQSGAFPIQAAFVDPLGIKGMVLIEPGGCGSTYTDAQLDILAKIPMLVIFGDNLKTTTGVPGFSWFDSYTGCKDLVAKIKDAGGNAKVIHLPSLGIKGNTHVPMQDKNNKDVADLILLWLKNNEK